MNTAENDEALSSLIGDIYDAALDPSRWTIVLGKAREFVGGFASPIYSKDATGRTGNLHYIEGGIEERYHQLYFEKYVKLDPTTTGQFFVEVEQPYSTVDILPYDEFLASRVYLEWARPQGLVDHIAAVLDKSATSFAAFGIFRHARDGVVGEEERRRMRLIVPHVRRAVLIARVIDLKPEESANLADGLDTLNAGMFLLGAEGRIVHANLAGHGMLADGELLRASGGRLLARDPDIDHDLHETLSAAANGDAAVGSMGISLPLRAASGARYVAHLLPLTARARRARIPHTAVAAMFVHDATLETPSAPEVIARAYRLTPTELRVLLAIAEIGGAPEVAEALGIGETTVKTHLGRLFEKTGARRQVDLVKLVAGFANPLIG